MQYNFSKIKIISSLDVKFEDYVISQVTLLNILASFSKKKKISWVHVEQIQRNRNRCKSLNSSWGVNG